MLAGLPLQEAAAAAAVGSSGLKEGEMGHHKHGAAALAPVPQPGLVGGQQQLGRTAVGRGQRAAGSAAAELADRDL